MEIEPNVSITISKLHHSFSEDSIQIELVCEKSYTHFCTIKMTLEDFAKAITGMGHIKVFADLRGLQYVGKRRIREERTVLYPFTSLSTHKREEMEKWLEENCQEEGWILDSYLGSRSSISYAENVRFYNLHYSVYKYIDENSSVVE